MKRRLETIELSLIEPARRSPLCFRRRLPGENLADRVDLELVESIEKHGIIDPPILMDRVGTEHRPWTACGIGPGTGCGTGKSHETGSGVKAGSGAGMAVVSGHRRVAAAAASGLSAIDALIVEASMEEIVPVWLEEAAFGRPPSDLERIYIASKALEFSGGDPSSHLPALSRIFGRGMTAEILRSLVRLLDLGDDELEALHDGRLSPGDLLLFDGHPVIDQADAARMLAAEGTSRAAQKETARLMLYLADQGADRWNSFVRRRLAGGDPAPLVDSFRGECLPTLQGDLAEMERLTGEIGLPTEASISIPANLEGGGLRLEIKIRDEKRLETVLSKIRRGIDDGHIGRMLGIIRGRSESRQPPRHK